MPEERIDDFCCVAPAVFRYPVEDFITQCTLPSGTAVHVEGGHWYACEVCAAYIDDRDLTGLVTLWVTSTINAGGKVKPGFILYLRRFWPEVFAHMGPREPYTPEPPADTKA